MHYFQSYNNFELLKYPGKIDSDHRKLAIAKFIAYFICGFILGLIINLIGGFFYDVPRIMFKETIIL